MARKGWDSSSITKPRKWKSTNTTITFEHVKGEGEALKAMLGKLDDNDFWQDAIDAFMKGVLIPEMAKDWRERENNPAMYPTIIEATHDRDALNAAAGGGALGAAQSKKKKNKRQSPQLNQDAGKQEMQQGMRDLFNIMTRWEKVTIGSTVAGAAIGNMKDLTELKLSRYMPHQQGKPSVKSKYNTLYYAVEYGTGMLAGSDNGRPGSPQWIRGPEEPDAPTKDPRAEYRGAWWLGAPGSGMLWKGQAGFHFLSDARTREPRVKWQKFLLKELPKFLGKYVEENTGGAFSRSS